MKKFEVTAKWMREAYATLRDQAPFSKWNLPEPDEVFFNPRVIKADSERLSRSHVLCGQYRYIAREPVHVIRINGAQLPGPNWAQETMAHEMVHLAVRIALGRRARNPHGPEFQKRAKQVCRKFGYDMESF